MPTEPLTWPALKPGDLARLVSPASWPEGDELETARAALESWGLRVDVAPHALDRRGYLAGTDADRLADIDEAFRDPEVRVIVPIRGGAGAYRICDELDFDAVRADPKPVIGFSDITYLHASLWRECRLPAVHGFLMDDEAVATARRLMVTGEDVVARTDPTAYSAGVTTTGTATGPLLGGNLSTLAHLVGAGLPDLSGAILLLEDQRGMGLGRVDRQLTQLRRSGALDGLAGIAVGMLTGFDGYVDRDWELADVLVDHLGRLDVPVLGGLTIGHGAADQVCVALGSTAYLDADAGTLTSTSPVRRD